MRNVKIEIHKHMNASIFDEFEGRCLGYIDDAEFEIVLDSILVRNKLISSRTVSLKELNKADTNIIGKRLVFIIGKPADRELLITAKIKNKVCYTEKEKTTLEFMSLESEKDDWISLTED